MSPERAHETRQRIGLGDLVAGLLIAAFGGIYLWQVTVIPRGAAHSVVPPWGFPLFVGIGLSTLGLVLALKGGVLALRGQKRRHLPLEPIDWRPLLGVVGATILYTWLWTRLGFIAATILLIVCVARLFGSRAWLRNTIYAVLFTFVAYAIFALGIGIRLPAGDVFAPIL